MQKRSSYFSETHNMIRETARKFVEKEISPFIDEWEEQGSFPRELYSKMGAQGLLSIGYPREFGGIEGDQLLKISMYEEIMRAGSGGLAASLFSLDIGLPPLIKFGSQKLKEKIAPNVLAGEKIYALAITEPSGGSDVANLKTRAKKVLIDGKEHYRINGSKTFITSGSRADYLTLAVRTGDPGYKGISLIVVERETPGFITGEPLKKMGWWVSDTCELFFDNCLGPG